MWRRGVGGGRGKRPSALPLLCGNLFDLQSLPKRRSRREAGLCAWEKGMSLAYTSFGMTGACTEPFLPHGPPHRAPLSTAD